MSEANPLHGSADDARAGLREQYLELLSGDFLELPFVLAADGADPRQRDKLGPTLGEYERLMGLAHDGALPPKHADRAAELFRELLDQMRNAPGPAGTPMSKEAIDRWAEQHAQGVASGTYAGIPDIMDGLSRQVELDLAHLRLALPAPVFAAEYPTGDFNAWTVPATGGVLVLINRGLFVLIYLMAKLYALCMHLDFPTAGQTSVRLGTEGLIVPDDGPPKAVIVDLAVDVLLSYLTLRQPTKARRLPPLPWPRGQIVTVLTTQAEKFVIAHEYGHVVAGHVTATESVRDAADDPLRHPAMDWAQEFQADGYAAAVMVTRDATAAGIGGGDLGWMQAVASGPAFFFALDDLVGRTRAVLGEASPTAADHPPSSQRWQLLRQGFALTHGPAALTMADGCVEWARALGQDVASRLTELGVGS